MKTLDIAIAGEINLDLIMSGLPEEMALERELLADGFTMTLGSSSAILAHNLSLLGARVGFVTMVGQDPLGAIALDYLERAGVDLSRTIHSRNGTNTGVTMLLTHSSTHSSGRHILTYPGTMSEMRVQDLDLGYLKSARHFHLSSLFLQKGLQPDLPDLFRELKEAGLTLSLDTNDDPADEWKSGLQELLGLVDIVMPNDAEACHMTQTNDVEEAAEVLAKKVPLVAIKCGRRGALVRYEGERWLVASEPVNPVDTIGAGDSFNAGFLEAYLRGCSPVECAAQGNRVAALSTQRAGGVAAFLDRQLRSLFVTS
jgi:sugar/nucleoside kinase (ribokinase family)